MVTIGVLALQGDVAEHVRALENSGARALLVRRVSELDQVDGLVIPGGESTTMSNLLLSFGLFDALNDRIASGLPVYGTCAGMIMLAMVLQAMNIPVDMIMIIYGVDRLFDMGRTCLNITGDISCALCDTKWESKKAAEVK